ncbi:MAG: hypothetical protein HS114_33190 [Anaerolineales bacterium]|nr:hypothetical protein [Anaerolineales bacterium]
METDREHCLAAGANAFISKPIRQEELLAQLGRQLQLTWMYEQPSLEPVEALQIDLPREEVELLYSLAQRGRIPEIRTRLDELEQRRPEYQAFVAQLRRLARHYRSKDIQTLLESYRQE